MTEEIPGQESLFDPTAEQLEAHRDAFQNTLAGLRKGNKSLVDELRQLGQRIDPGNVALVKLDCLMALILDEDAKLHLDVEFEQQMSKVLKASLDAVRRRQLMDGGKGFPFNGNGLPR